MTLLEKVTAMVKSSAEHMGIYDFILVYDGDTMAMEEEDSDGNILYMFSTKIRYTYGRRQQYLFYYQG